ncbi:hypothetical protein [Roseibium sp.]|uniref:hypothetical protein n=1 Tax=Roseibium sp. TaxID=1936156 RepID=UPI003B5224C9
MSWNETIQALFEENEVMKTKNEGDRKAEAAKGGPAVFMSNIDGDPMRVSIYGVTSDEMFRRVTKVLSELDKEIQAANQT